MKQTLPSITKTLIAKYGKANLKRYHDNRMKGMSVIEAQADADKAFPLTRIPPKVKRKVKK